MLNFNENTTAAQVTSRVSHICVNKYLVNNVNEVKDDTYHANDHLATAREHYFWEITPCFTYATKIYYHEFFTIITNFIN